MRNARNEQTRNPMIRGSCVLRGYVVHLRGFVGGRIGRLAPCRLRELDAFQNHQQVGRFESEERGSMRASQC